MKNLRKDNKGFSLVELIVVVLIMAIIAVALAPQVIKWVNNSRISSDVNTKDAIVAAAQNALTNETVYADCKNASFDLTVSESTHSYGSAPASFQGKFKEYAGGDISTFKVKQKNATITVSVSGGKVSSSISGSGVQSEITDN